MIDSNFFFLKLTQRFNIIPTFLQAFFGLAKFHAKNVFCQRLTEYWWVEKYTFGVCNGFPWKYFLTTTDLGVKHDGVCCF